MTFRLATALLIAFGIGAGFSSAARAAGNEPRFVDEKPEQKVEEKKDDKAVKGEAPAEEKKGEGKVKKKKTSGWIEEYRAAVFLVRAERYEEAIAAFARLDEAATTADVRNYMGFANRKLGRMTLAREHYEAALALDPTHRGVLEYYGEWHAEAGDIAGARAILSRLEALHGRDIPEYGELSRAIRYREAGLPRGHS